MISISKMSSLLIIGLCTTLIVQMVNGEVFTALAEMEELLETEAVLISNLETYIDAQDEKLKFLRR